VLVVLALVAGCSTPFLEPRVEGGRIDLSEWDFEESGIVHLDGDWSICWGHLLGPETTDCPGRGWEIETVPGLWSEGTADGPFGGRGLATYRLRITLPAVAAPMAIRAGAPHTASRVWIDGKQQEGTGRVGPTAETTSAEPRRNRLYEFEGGGEHVVQVQVANFVFRGGGLRRIWVIGPPDAIQSATGRAVLREALLFGVGALVGIAYLVQFALRPTDRARGYFGLGALALGLRAVPASISDLGQLLLPWASFEWMIRLEYVGASIVLFAGAGYVLAKVPNVMPPRTMRGIQLVAIALILISLLAPFSHVVETVVFYIFIPATVLVLVVLEYGRAWLRRVPNVGGTLIGASLYLVAMIHDVIRTLDTEFGLWSELSPYFVVNWILIEANDLMQSFSRSFARIETLSKDLHDANFELEETEAAVVRFVPFDLLRLLGKHSIREVAAGDHARTPMSVLYCAVHGLTDESDAARIEADFSTFNALVRRCEPAIDRHEGFVSHCVGHALIALFPARPERAVEAALEIFEIVDVFNREAETSIPQRRPIEVGIAITTGPLLVGTVGGEEHLTSSVIGHAIDAAPRIEALSHGRPQRLLITESTRDGMRDPAAFTLRPIDGATHAEDDLGRPVYEVLGLAGSARADVGS